MKKNFFFSIALTSFLFAGSICNAQCFRKGSLLVSISEGATKASYSTSDISDATPKPVKQKCIDGIRDPLILEFGLSNRWGIGLTQGNDIFTVNSNDFYGFSTSNSGNIDTKTNEFTVDVSYHVFVSKKLDLSVVSSAGVFSVNFKGNDNWYNYQSNGTIVRVGTRARYYFYKRLGAFGMVSTYNGKASPKDVKGNDSRQGGNYSTHIHGFAVEMGLCYRFF